MCLVLAREVTDLDTVLCKLGQSKETLLEFFSFFRALVKLLEFLAVVDLVLKTALHDLFSDFFDALDKERLEFVALRAHVNLISNNPLCLLFLPVNNLLQVSDSICVACLQCLHILDDFLFNFVSVHF